MSGECKIERRMPKEGLPGFFRDLADALENGGGEGEFEKLDGFVKLKVSLKEEFGGFSVKLKVKGPKQCVAPGYAASALQDAEVEGPDLHGSPDSPDSPGAQDAQAGPEGLPRYKSLKKRMKNSFKLILRMLHEGQTPPAEAVASFLADAEVMCAYPGKGDPFYPEFLQVCREFSDAYDSCDLPRMGAMAEELAHQKARCHAIYD